MNIRGLCSVNPFETIDKIDGQLRHECAARFQMVASAEGIVNAVYIVFTVGMGIAEGKVVAVRYNRITLRMCKLYAVLRLPASADIVGLQGIAHILIGIARQRACAHAPCTTAHSSIKT